MRDHSKQTRQVDWGRSKSLLASAGVMYLTEAWTAERIVAMRHPGEAPRLLVEHG